MDIQSELMEERDSTNITVAAYLRVSLSRQAKEGYSLDAQMDKINEFVQKNDWYLPENLIFREEKPATTFEGYEVDKINFIENFSIRPQLSELLRKAQRKEFKHLIVYSRDRLSRCVEDSLALELFFNKLNIKIHYVKSGEDFQDNDSEISRLLHIIFTSLGEMEANILSSRISDAGKACTLKGRWAGGKIPLGYVPVIHKCDSENKKKWYTTLEKSEFESKLIEEIYKLYSSGMGYRKIASYMNEKYGFIPWSKSKIEAIIQNRTYTGQIAWDRRGGRRNPKKRNNNPILSPFEPQNSIISIEKWNEIIDERERRNKSKDAYYYDTEFILKDKLKCSKCKKFLKARNPGNGRSNVYKCANTKEERSMCNVIIPACLIEDEFVKYMRNNIFKIDEKEINKNIFWKKYEEAFIAKKDKYSNMVKEVDKKIKNYEELLINIKERMSVEKDNYIKEALHTQHVIYNNLIDNYKESLIYLQKQMNVIKKDKEELYETIGLFMPAIFIQEKSKEITRIRREFIIDFIEEIIVSYNKNEKKVTIDKIVFNAPEFI